MKALQSSDALLRSQSALALGAIGPDAREAVAALTMTLDDPEWSVRRQAVLALGEIGPGAAPPSMRCGGFRGATLTG